MAAALLGLASCTLLVDSNQCATDGDCQKKGAAYASAVCSGGLCTNPGSSSGRCTKNAQCGTNFVCNKTRGECVSLVSEDCVNVIGDYSRDDALVVGVVLKIVGTSLGGSPAMVKGIELARDEISEVARGLPINGGQPRPLVVVECNQVNDAVRATRYLSQTIGVSAIIGASSSGTTTAMATDVTIPGGVLLLSPTATSPTLTSLPDEGLVWRVSPSDNFQGRVMVDLYKTLEDRVVTATPALKDKVKVALVTKGDSYGKGLRDVIAPALKINGASALTQQGTYFASKEYPNTDDDANKNYDFTPLVTELVTFKPHVVITAGTSEAVAVVSGIESRLQPGDPRPFYLVADGLVSTDLPTAVDGLDSAAAASLRSRTLGVVAGNPRAQSFLNFSLRLSSKYGAGAVDPLNAALGYDALYLVAYAAVATQSTQVTGAKLADALKRIGGKTGTVVSFEPNRINDGMKLLLAGQTVNVSGASGPLDFDTSTGDPVSDIDVQSLCLSQGKTAWTSSGLAFDAASEKLVGSIQSCP